MPNPNPPDRSFDLRERIRDAIDIVDLVERYVPLRRQGANFVGRCPWHDDSRPSLQVNPQRQTFKCWVCNIGGDIFSFVMKRENVDFKEALQILADIAGIDASQAKRAPRGFARAPYRPGNGGGFGGGANGSANGNFGGGTNDGNGSNGGGANGSASGAANAPGGSGARGYVPKEITKATLYKAVEWLAGKYRDAFLRLPEAEAARTYVRERGISDESSERFGIGYAPLGFDAALNWVGGFRERVRVLEAAGVLAYREEYDDRGYPKPRPKFAQTPKLSDAERRRYYDRFRGRVIFPIRDAQDRVVAFGGRLLPNTTLKSPAKYVNSPETPIFTKSKTLYGLDLARDAIRRSKRVLITEGYTDCIMTAQFGFENVVAVLGTALGPEHVRVLKRFADRMILLLDGDAPGQKRAREVLRFFVEQGVDASVLTLPDNDDPCEFLLERGAEAFEERLENGPVDALEHAFRTATAGVDLENDVVGSAKALDSVLEVVALFPEKSKVADDPIRLRFLKTIQRIATQFRISESEIRRQLVEYRRKQAEYAAKTAEYEERYKSRTNDNSDDGADGELGSEPEADQAEKEIAEFRRANVYPIPGPNDETDAELRERFAPFARAVWDDRRFLPNSLEREYLQIWLEAPQYYSTLVDHIPFESLRSPVTRQLDLLARDYWAAGIDPTFERILARYDDESVKMFLIDLDDSAAEKGLLQTLADPESRERLFGDVVSGFERAALERETPRRIGFLRETDASAEEKLRALLECRNLLRRKQQNRLGGTAFKDGSGSSDDRRFDVERNEQNDENARNDEFGNDFDSDFDDGSVPF